MFDIKINKNILVSLVGSGAAGSALGARLSEVPHWKVLVLESGDTPPPESYVPAFDLLTIEGQASWNYRTTPQNQSHFGYINRVSENNFTSL